MVTRALIFVHRWLGVLLCVCFLLWFPSGIGMMYFRMPDVTPADRLERSPTLNPSTITVSPPEAAMRLGVDPDDLRLTTFDGRPAYRLGGGRRGADGPVLYADTGDEQGEIPMDMVQRAAANWTRQPVTAAVVEEVQEPDQWTLQTPIPDLSPLWKYSWPNGEQVYVSQATGDVVQYTTRASRFGAYLGPIPHWFYFTPLRRHGLEWSRLVIWSSGIGTIAAIIGVVVGAWLYSPARKYRHAGVPTSIPYRGQKRWHTVLGLVFGVATVTYAFSGLLSMDPFPSFNDRRRQVRGADEPNVFAALRGELRAEGFDAKSPREALEQLHGLDVKELALTSFAGDPIYLARLADGTTRVVPMRGEPQLGFAQEAVTKVISDAAGGRMTTQVLTQYDRYYLDRTGRLPLPVILAQSTTGSGTRYYIDPGTARVVQTYNPANWVNRWLYTGLHSLNFPWLYRYRPLWDIVVITLMVGGTALCVTSLILAWRVVGRTLRRAVRPRDLTGDAALSEDLA